MPSLRAIIYLRQPDDHRCLSRCEKHCARRGYRLVGVVVDPDASRWPDVVINAMRGEFEIAVLCRREDLPPGRVPRMEFAEFDEDESIRRRRPRDL